MKVVNYLVKSFVLFFGTCIIPFMFPLMMLMHGHYVSDTFAGLIWLVFFAAGIYMMIEKKPLDIFGWFDKKSAMGKIMVVVMEFVLMIGIVCIYESMGIPLE